VAIKLNGKQEANLLNQKQAIVVDPDAAKNMYLETDGFYSQSGFSVYGLPDGFNLNSLPNFSGIEFHPRFYINGYDAFFAFVKNASSYVGPAVKTRLEPNGKMFFSDFLLQTNDGASIPVEAVVPLTNTLNQLGNEAGF